MFTILSDFKFNGAKIDLTNKNETNKIELSAQSLVLNNTNNQVTLDCLGLQADSGNTLTIQCDAQKITLSSDAIDIQGQCQFNTNSTVEFDSKPTFTQGFTSSVALEFQHALSMNGADINVMNGSTIKLYSSDGQSSTTLSGTNDGVYCDKVIQSAGFKGPIICLGTESNSIVRCRFGVVYNQMPSAPSPNVIYFIYR